MRMEAPDPDGRHRRNDHFCLPFQYGKGHLDVGKANGPSDRARYALWEGGSTAAKG